MFPQCTLGRRRVLRGFGIRAVFFEFTYMLADVGRPVNLVASVLVVVLFGTAGEFRGSRLYGLGKKLMIAGVASIWRQEACYVCHSLPTKAAGKGLERFALSLLSHRCF